MNDIDFQKVADAYHLMSLVNKFDNCIQAKGNSAVENISWKQYLMLVCINRCEKIPTINDLSTINGTSHQNTKQLLLKLEKAGLIKIIHDDKDKRKQRVLLTDKEQEHQKFYKQLNIRIVKSIFSDIKEDDLKTSIKTIDKIIERVNELEL